MNMKKLSLPLDDLQVETFDPLPGAGRCAGTVLGRGETDAEETCAGEQTCFPTGKNATPMSRLAQLLRDRNLFGPRGPL